MKALRPYMAEQERRNVWSLRWLIVGAFVQAGAVLYLALGEAGRARVPLWAFYVWGLLALIVAALAAIAKSVQPQGGVLNLPLGPAIIPHTPAAAAKAPTAGAAPEDAPPPAPHP